MKTKNKRKWQKKKGRQRFYRQETNTLTIKDKVFAFVKTHQTMHIENCVFCRRQIRSWTKFLEKRKLIQLLLHRDSQSSLYCCKGWQWFIFLRNLLRRNSKNFIIRSLLTGAPLSPVPAPGPALYRMTAPIPGCPNSCNLTHGSFLYPTHLVPGPFTVSVQCTLNRLVIKKKYANNRII